MQASKNKQTNKQTNKQQKNIHVQSPGSPQLKHEQIHHYNDLF